MQIEESGGWGYGLCQSGYDSERISQAIAGVYVNNAFGEIKIL